MIIFLYSDLLLIHPCLYLIHYLPLTHLHSLHITLSQVIHLTQPIQSIVSILQLLPLHRPLNTLPNPLFKPYQIQIHFSPLSRRGQTVGTWEPSSQKGFAICNFSQKLFVFFFFLSEFNTEQKEMDNNFLLTNIINSKDF